MGSKINIENCFFHGLAGGIPFWEEERVIAEGIKQLRYIIKLKGILSRRVLRESHGISYDEKEPVYNGDEYISLCIKNPKKSEFTGEFSTIDPAFYRYIKYKIGIAISPNIVSKATFRMGDYKRLPGERQVLDNIDISDFMAIVVGLPNRSKVMTQLEDILKNTGIPITDIDGNILTSEKEITDFDMEK